MRYNRFINLMLKLALFSSIIWLISKLTLLLFLPGTTILFLALFLTTIGVIAEPIFLPALGNLPATFLGAAFIGITTYYTPHVVGTGSVTLWGSVIVALALGIVEYVLHKAL
ncbi:MAG: DUF2512 family protein, partial [Bacillota bacterium]|nr:DUF2512 family protein [Bacillota bacterium]